MKNDKRRLVFISLFQLSVFILCHAVSANGESSSTGFTSTVRRAVANIFFSKDDQLFSAVSDGQVEKTRELVNERGIDLNRLKLHDSSGTKIGLLNRAILKNNSEIVKILLDAGIDVNLKQTASSSRYALAEENDYELAPVHLAIRKGNPEIIKLILHTPSLQIRLEDYYRMVDLAYQNLSEPSRSETIKTLKRLKRKQERLLSGNMNSLLHEIGEVAKRHRNRVGEDRAKSDWVKGLGFNNEDCLDLPPEYDSQEECPPRYAVALDHSKPVIEGNAPAYRLREESPPNYTGIAR